MTKIGWNTAVNTPSSNHLPSSAIKCTHGGVEGAITTGTRTVKYYGLIVVVGCNLCPNRYLTCCKVGASHSNPVSAVPFFTYPLGIPSHVHIGYIRTAVIGNAYIKMVPVTHGAPYLRPIRTIKAIHF